MDKMLPVLVVVAIVLAAAYFLRKKGGGASGVEARQLVEAGARLVDVRTSAEFAAGHVSGALNIPVQELAGRLSELEPKEAPVVVYCRSGHRSSSAARVLKNAGFKEVRDLGAMTNW